MRRAALVTMVLGLALGVGGAWGATRDETVYADTPGDSGAALDITAVHVADNGTDIGFRVPFPGGFPAPDDIVEIVLETDKKATTGRTRDGADWMLFFQGGNPSSFGLARFDGDTLTTVHFDDVEVVWGLGLEFDVAKDDLGITNGFDFSVVTSVGLPIQPPNVDHGPDTGTWHYDLTGIPAGIVYDSVVTTAAKKPRQGKAFALQVAVRLVAGAASATRAPDALTCTATVAGKTKLKTTIAIPSQRAATCRMTIPKKSKGKTLSVRLTARYGAESKPATYSAKITA
jgi:hypothetical protein